MQLETIKAGVVISDKIDYKSKTTLKRDKGHYIMVKGSIQQEDMTVFKIYEPNIRALKCIKQTFINLKGEVDCNAIILGDFNCQ